MRRRERFVAVVVVVIVVVGFEGELVEGIDLGRQWGTNGGKSGGGLTSGRVGW